MGSSRFYAYNPTLDTTGVEYQFGLLAISYLNTPFPPEFQGTYITIGPDEDLGCVIATLRDDLTCNNCINGEVTDKKISFWRSDGVGDTEFLDAVLCATNLSFETKNDACTWMNDNGFWCVCCQIEITPTPTPTVTPTTGSVTPTPTQTPISSECSTSTYDVVLLLDQSGSISNSEFSIMSAATVDLVSKLSSYLSSGATGFQFGVVAFSTVSSTLQTLTADQNLINAAIGTRIYSNLTRIDRGLQQAYLTSIGTNTRNANKKIVLYTDGNPSSNEADAILTADTINNSVYNSIYRTEILCVGIGDGVAYSNLLDYAADPSLVFSANTFEDIKNINTQIVNGICRPIIVPTPTPTLTVTPTPTSLPQIYTHGAVLGTCSDYCTINYNITTLTFADADYGSLIVGGTIYGQSGAGFVAYSNVSTDTATGPFKIAEIDASGVVLALFECSGVSCLPI